MFSIIVRYSMVLLHNSGCCNCCITKQNKKSTNVAYNNLASRLLFDIKDDSNKKIWFFWKFLSNIGFLVNCKLISTKSVLWCIPIQGVFISVLLYTKCKTAKRRKFIRYLYKYKREKRGRIKNLFVSLSFSFSMATIIWDEVLLV